MLAMPGLRAFSLSADRHSGGVSCDERGLSIGRIPLLSRLDLGQGWSVRPLAELNDELTVCYQIPVDITTKTAALALIANALNRSDFALAAIAAVQMQFPDPPPLARGVETGDEIARRALELYRSGLLKADWDPAKHPRTGTPPNRGRFAPVPKETLTPDLKSRRTGWPPPHVNKMARTAVAEAAEIFARTGRYLLFGLPIVDGIAAFIDAYSPTELNQAEDRLTAQLKAALQPPKTLEELQQNPTEDILGYEPHHIVGQNPDNLAKDVFEKFGRNVIDDPSNIVWVPRLQHECVSAEYSRNSAGPGTPTLRENINKLDFSQQREAGLSILRECGALK